MKENNTLINHEIPLSEYLKYFYEHISFDWNVDSLLKLFGIGKSNEETIEANYIKRYYVEPLDIRFNKIYLNYNDSRNILSIVWFINENHTKLTLRELKKLFGEFIIQNIIYDESTDVIFSPNKNKNIKFIKTTISEWIEKRPNGTLYYIKNNKEIELSEDYTISCIVFEIKNTN